MRAQSVVIGVLAGVAAGALLGILFAPDKGSEVRGKIAKKGEDYLDSIKGSINSVLDGFATKVNKVKDEASDIIESRKSKREMQASAS